MKNESVRMFKNPILELLSLSGPVMMISYHVIVISLVLGYGIYTKGLTAFDCLVFFLSGFVVWTLAEYSMHRWAFHFERPSNKVVSSIHHALHGHHHDHPRDNKRLFMPPVPATILLLVFFGLFYLFLGSKAYAFLPGFEFGYLLYSILHYCIHTYTPPKRLKFLWVHHTMHHYQQEDKALGVSTRFWDKVFGTMPELRKIKK